MRGIAKASSAGSTQRQASRLGRIVQAARAACVSSPHVDGSGAPPAGVMRSPLVRLGALPLALAALLLFASPAFSATVTQRPLLFTFNGSDTSAGALKSGNSIAIDNATGAVYVAEANPGSLERFHADGTPWPFSATGKSSISGLGGRAAVAVDNSGGPNQGRVFISSTDTDLLQAFDPTGSFLWGLPLEGSYYPNDTAVDSSGHPWLIAQLEYAPNSAGLHEFATAGSPPAQINSVHLNEGRKVDFNSAGDAFIIPTSGQVQKWVGGSFSSVLDPHAADVYVDQSASNGDIFTVTQGESERQEFRTDATAGQFRLSFNGEHTGDLPLGASYTEVKVALESLPSIGANNIFVCQMGAESEHRYCLIFEGKLAKANVDQVTCENGSTPLTGGSGCSAQTTSDGEPANFQEYAASGTLLGTFGEDYLGDAQSVAYSPTLDRVYMLNEGANANVEVFGPSQTGIAPDVEIESPSAITVSSAQFKGTVNPQGTSSEWHFEWRKPGQSWGAASASPAASLPTDSNAHTVEYTTNSLGGNTTYEVRLVAVNTANGLAGISPSDTLHTQTAAEAPAVSIAAPSAIGVTTAKISGTVNPNGDTATWRVQVSRDPSCGKGFEDRDLQSISPASNNPVTVEYELRGLLPAEHYCARIVATNSAGSVTSEVKEFETQEAAPTQVFTGFAGPRTDTSARLNGYVNPEGSKATYRFEYSVDGATWTALPDQQSPKARRQIVVDEELTGLAASTTYHYRFSVENGGGPAVPQGAEKDFTTRSTSEMQSPQRGLELVNQPDKGNQNVLPSTAFQSQSPVEPSGNRAMWSVIGSAPGGNSASEPVYVAQRTSSGWTSKSIIPSPENQVGEGNLPYKFNESNESFTRFLFHVSQSGALTEGPPTFVTADVEGNQQVLTSYPEDNGPRVWLNTEVTEDMRHVFMVVHSTRQLEDLVTGEVVSIMPDGLESQCGVPGSDGFTGFETEARIAGSQWRIGYNRIDKINGSRVYFEAVPNGRSCNSNPGIYSRNVSTGTTTEVDAGQAKQPPTMIRTTLNGRLLYFVTATSHVAEDENQSGDVYRWDADTGDYTCLTCVVEDAAIGTESRVLVSDDFSHVYFTSGHQLVPGYGEPGEENVYELSEGALKFVADVRAGAVLDWNYSRLSSNGNVLVFETDSNGSYMGLTGDRLDEGNCTGAHSPTEAGPCTELFRYEAATEALECVSCEAGGVTKAQVGSPGPKAMAISADGQTVAFATEGRLVREDINNGYDVYEWKRGKLSLITNGETQYPYHGAFIAPRVYGMDASGDNIFFAVDDPGLTGYEQDGVLNLYDARVGGGFPRPEEAAHCSEESCQGPLAPAPEQAGAGSASVRGLGNVVAPRACRKGLVRRHGHCVGRHKRRKKQKHQRHLGHVWHSKQGNSGRAK